MALDIVARKVQIVKANNGGVAPYGAVTAIVSDMKPTLPWLNVEMLTRSHMKKLNQQKSKQPAECATASPAADSSYSTLTVDTKFPVDSSIVNDNTTATPTGTSILGGRPVGSTTSNKRDFAAGHC